jgi:phospholipid transport system substrate-binding protein
MIARRAFLLACAALPFAARAQTLGPAAPIAAFLSALQAATKAGKFASRAAIIRPAINTSFDLPVILAATVGTRWAGFPDDVKARLLDAFTDFTVASWAANFDADHGDTFEVAPDRRQVGSDEIVQTRIVPKTGETTRLDYVMRQNTGQWRVVDVLVNGAISRVAVQRSDFRSLLAAGDAAPLINMLSQKAALLAVDNP